MARMSEDVSRVRMFLDLQPCIYHHDFIVALVVYTMFEISVTLTLHCFPITDNVTKHFSLVRYPSEK